MAFIFVEFGAACAAYDGIRSNLMTAFTAVVEKCPTTAFYVGYVPGFPGAHSRGETLD